MDLFAGSDHAEFKSFPWAQSVQYTDMGGDNSESLDKLISLTN